MMIWMFSGTLKKVPELTLYLSITFLLQNKMQPFRITFFLFFFISFSYQVDAQATMPMAKDHSKFLGNIIPQFIPNNFTNLWNQVTPENAGKWGSLESTRNVMSWTNLDRAYNLAKNNNYKYRYHTLVWGSQEPSWLKNLPADQQLIELDQFMSLVAQRYPNIDYIDVVNEPIHAQSSMKEALGGDGVTGWDWVVTAFEKARHYFPNAKLHINEYHVMAGWTDDVLNQYLNIIKILNDRKLIDGIGIQSHHFNMNLVTVTQMRNKLNKLAVFGLPIYVTELDITGKPQWESDDDYRIYRTNNPVEDENRQYERYKQKFPVLWEHEAVAGVTLWGYIEGSTWAVGSGILNSDFSERKAMTWLKQYMASEASKVPNKFTSTSRNNNVKDNHSEINIFPNPATDFIYIKADEAYKVEILTLTGSVIMSFPKNPYMIDVNALDSGVYFLSLQGENETISRKLVKK